MLKTADQNKKCYIIAEISCNHNGDLNEAMSILHASKQAGADAIKLQTYTADTITRDFKNKPKGTMWETTDLYSLYQKAYTPWDWQIKIKEEADKLGIDFLSTPFDETSVDFLINDLKVSSLKVASFEGVDTKLLARMAKTKLPILMSNGMMDYSELYEAVDILRKNGCDDLTLLQCNSGYPARFKDANLRTIRVMKELFKCKVGVSDHTLFADTEKYSDPMPHITPLEAVKLGAEVVEVHIQMDREKSRSLMQNESGGFDWAFSRTPEEFLKMVEYIRAFESKDEITYDLIEKNLAEQTLGAILFEPTEKEKASRKLRPSLWITKDIRKGEDFVFEAESELKGVGNFDSIRPGGGLHIRYTDFIIGKKAIRDIKSGTPMDWLMLDI